MRENETKIKTEMFETKIKAAFFDLETRTEISRPHTEHFHIKTEDAYQQKLDFLLNLTVIVRDTFTCVIVAVADIILTFSCYQQPIVKRCLLLIHLS